MMRARLMKPMLTAVLLVFAAGLLTTGGTPARAAAEGDADLIPKIRDMVG